MSNRSGRLVPPFTTPRGIQVPPGVQPGSPLVIQARFIIVSGAGGGLFLYSGKPALGNPPILWDSLATKDPYGNAITPGAFLAQTAGSGNAKGGLLWNTATPGAAEPLLALFPNSTYAFTGNAPFVLGRVINRGLVKETVSLAFGGGGNGSGSSPVQMEIFAETADGLNDGHISFYDWATTNLICDINASGIVAADPTTANTLETWHTLTVAAPWTNNVSDPVRYRLLPDGNVQFSGAATAAAQAGTTTLSASPLPAGYRPAIAQDLGPALVNANTVQGVNVSTAGVVAVRSPTGTTTLCSPQGAYPLN